MDWETSYYQKALYALSDAKVKGKKIERILEVVRALGNNASMLDIGCGEASVSEAVCEGSKYFGIDVSQYAIDRAKEKYKNRGNISLQQGSVHGLPFEDGTFDLALSFYSLEHFDQPQKSLDEMVRVTKKGGRIILCAPNLEFPLAYPSALRHKPFWYRFYFAGLRIKDYALRFFGKRSFRTIKENFLEATGRYEKGDDDLRHLVSSYEVIGYLEDKGLEVSVLHKIKRGGFSSVIKKIISWMPLMRHYGKELFIMAKNP